MRYLLILSLFLTACAKDKKSSSEETASCTKLTYSKDLILVVGDYRHDRMYKYTCQNCIIAWDFENEPQKEKITICPGSPFPITVEPLP